MTQVANNTEMQYAHFAGDLFFAVIWDLELNKFEAKVVFVMNAGSAFCPADWIKSC